MTKSRNVVASVLARLRNVAAAGGLNSAEREELTRQRRENRFVGGGTPGVGIELAEQGKGAAEGPVLNWGCQYSARCLGRF